MIQDALEALARTTGLQAEIDALQPRTPTQARWADARVVIRNDGKTHTYIVEVKTLIDRRELLNHVQHQLHDHEGPGLLVTAYLTADLAKHCRDVLNLQFIDTAGNAYLRAPGLYVYIRGEREPVFDATTIAKRGGGTNTALRVIFALLCRPELLNAPYRDINRAAHVALGAVGWVFFDLEKRRLIVGRKGNRRFLDRRRLFEEFATNYPIKFRPKLVTPRRLRAENPDWWLKADLAKHGAVWGGEIAADRLTGNRAPTQFTVYLPGDPAKFILENRLRADPLGDIEIVRRFWRFDLDQPYPADLAPPLLIYADLMATPDPRNHDTAKQVYARYLVDALGQA
jgi:hypothetical protein